MYEILRRVSRRPMARKTSQILDQVVQNLHVIMYNNENLGYEHVQSDLGERRWGKFPLAHSWISGGSGLGGKSSLTSLEPCNEDE